MKKSRLFMVTGALVLAVSAIFATKANKKFTSFIKGYAGTSGAYIETTSAGNWLTTLGGVGITPAIVTIQGGRFGLYTQLRTGSTSTNKPLYLL